MNQISNSTHFEAWLYCDESNICPDPIEKKIKSFSDLDLGWNYGEGESITQEVIKKALEVYKIGKSYCLDCEVFAITDGSIEVSLYRKDHFMDFLIKEDNSIDFTHEVGTGNKYKEVENINNISIDNIKNKINGLIESCNGLESLATITIKAKGGLPIIVSGTAKTKPFQFFWGSVSAIRTAPQCASILKNIILPLQESTQLVICR